MKNISFIVILRQIIQIILRKPGSEMTREPSQVFDEFTISLLFRSYGWSDLDIITSRKNLNCRVSAVFTDVIEKLICFCSMLIDNRGGEILLQDEPGGYIWSLTPVAVQRHTMFFTVDEFDGIWDFNSPPLNRRREMEFVVKRKSMATILIGELWKVSTLSIEPSYQRSREVFAREAFERLLDRWEEWTSGRSRLPSNA